MADFGNPLRKFKLVFLGEQSGKGSTFIAVDKAIFVVCYMIFDFDI